MFRSLWGHSWVPRNGVQPAQIHFKKVNKHRGGRCYSTSSWMNHAFINACSYWCFFPPSLKRYILIKPSTDNADASPSALVELLTLKHVGKPQPLFIFPYAFSGRYRRETKFNQQLHWNPREIKVQPKSRKCSGKEAESHFGVTSLCREAFPPGFDLREWEGGRQRRELEEGEHGVCALGG